MSTATRRVIVVDGLHCYYADRVSAIADNGSDVQPADAIEPKPRQSDVAQYGTIILPVDSTSFRPGWLRDVPNDQLIAKELSHEHARDLTLARNADALEHGYARWHFLVLFKKSYGVCRVRVRCDTLPKTKYSHSFNGGDDLYLPTGSHKQSAIDYVESMNAGILESARVPRIWNVAVRDVRDAPADD